jgi:nucleotide-binding universal stress UspA family protein
MGGTEDQTGSMTLARLLVGDDGSSGAAAARVWAEALADALGAEAIVVRVDHEVNSTTHPPDIHEPGAHRELLGAPVPMLLAAAEDAAAGLIVVGRRGAGGFDALRLGSTAHQLAEHSTRPVAVVPETSAPAVNPWPFTMIGIGHDGTPAGAGALSWAASLAAASSAAVVVIHALDLGPAFAAAGLDDGYEQARARITSALQRVWCAPLGEEGIAYSTVVEDGGAAVVLLETVRSRKVDLLVVGRQAPTRLAGMAMGSVAHRALGLAPCPTVIVPLAD